MNTTFLPAPAALFAAALAAAPAFCQSPALPTTAPGAGAATAPATAPAEGEAGRNLPRPDHIVIVIEENHRQPQVIGSPDAPYINELAAAGANFSNSFAVTHPSQPNYLALFSGSTQGVKGDGVPEGTPFSTPNLGAELLAAGLGFAGYSEGQPSVGYLGAQRKAEDGKHAYVRKHNPWSDWQVKHAGSPAGGSPPRNQLPESASLPMEDHFPAAGGDFSALPTVSIVIPDERHDMHDGTVRQADDWLREHLEPYRRWAVAHNGLLIVTWDEDDFTPTNRIPTIFVGPMVKPGTYDERIDHYDVLRTVEEMYGLPHAGAAEKAKPITAPFAPARSGSARR